MKLHVCFIEGGVLGLMILLSKYIKGALAHFFQENIVFESLKKTLICH